MSQLSFFSFIFFVFSNRCTVLYQKRFKKERKIRIRVQQKLDTETKRRNQIEDALKASGAPAEALRILSGKFVFSFFYFFFYLIWPFFYTLVLFGFAVDEWWWNDIIRFCLRLCYVLVFLNFISIDFLHIHTLTRYTNSHQQPICINQ